MNIEDSVEELDTAEELNTDELDTAEELNTAEELDTAEELFSAEELDSAIRLSEIPFSQPPKPKKIPRSDQYSATPVTPVRPLANRIPLSSGHGSAKTARPTPTPRRSM